MDTNTTSGSKVCSLSAFERNAYFYGKLLTTRDFEAEQRYFIDKGRTAHRLLHGTGIVCGLNVDTVALSSDNKQLIVGLSEGYALDCCGREIVVPADKQHEVPAKVQPEVEEEKASDGKNYLYLEYSENKKEATEIPGEAAASVEDSCNYGRIYEHYKLSVSHTPPALQELGLLIEQKGVVLWYLFSVGPGFVGELDADGDVSPLLGKQFEDHGYVLTPQARVEVEQAGSRWRIVDVDHEYFVRLEDETLNVYSLCPKCTVADAKVFLAVVDIDEPNKSASINPEETAQYRSVVYSNALLRDRLFGHLADRANPHDTTAEQVGAPVSVEGVENPGGNIDLIADGAIEITSDNVAKTITVGETHSARTDNPHGTTAQQVGAPVSVEGVENPGGNIDLIAQGAIEITSDNVAKTITVGENHSARTDNPHRTSAEQVGALVSVEGVENPGGNIDLTSSDGSIRIQPNSNHHSINLTIARSSEEWPVIVAINWNNDQPLSTARFNDGLQVTFSEKMHLATLTLNTFIVTIELPEDKSRSGLRGYRSLILDGDVTSDPEPTEFHRSETWRFRPKNVIVPLVLDNEQVRCRVVLKGNAILDAKGTRHLDGDVFAKVIEGNHRPFTELVLPSGDGREGGDFESWFWLRAESSAEEPSQEAAFTRIEGIGSTFDKRLKEANVRTFADLAELTPGKLAGILRSSTKRVEDARLIEQARQLAQAG